MKQYKITDSYNVLKDEYNALKHQLIKLSKKTIDTTITNKQLDLSFRNNQDEISQLKLSNQHYQQIAKAAQLQVQ